MIAKISQLEKSLMQAQNEMKTTLSTIGEKEFEYIAKVKNLEESLKQVQNVLNITQSTDKESEYIAKVKNLEESLKQVQNELNITQASILEKEGASVKLLADLSKIQEVCIYLWPLLICYQNYQIYGRLQPRCVTMMHYISRSFISFSYVYLARSVC
jgi:oligoendopeptidase F